MRFRSLHNRRPPARASDASHARLSTPRLPPLRAMPWRSLWGRVYARWAAAPMPPTSAPACPSFCSSASSHDTTTHGTNKPNEEKPPQPAPQCGSQPHTSLRAYLQRKRGEMWFLTKRRHDTDHNATGEAEEIEVPPPPLVVCDATTARPLLPQLILPIRQDSLSAPSEIAISMSSYSTSSNELHDGDDDDDEDEELKAINDEASSRMSEEENARDSYATATSDCDPFLQRYSSWYSIDDEQSPVCISDENDDADDEDEDENGKEEEEEAESRSPTIEELYEVRYVDIGGTPTPVAGIWV